MRIIKFRVWDKDEKQMLRPPVELQTLLRQIADRNDNSIGGDAIRRHELVWMQFTGHHDRNNRELYEGDICKLHHVEDGLIVECKWQDHWTGFSLFGPETHQSYSPAINWMDENPVEIIGNIYENPEQRIGRNGA